MSDNTRFGHFSVRSRTSSSLSDTLMETRGSGPTETFRDQCHKIVFCVTDGIAYFWIDFYAKFEVPTK